MKIYYCLYRIILGEEIQSFSFSSGFLDFVFVSSWCAYCAHGLLWLFWAVLENRLGHSCPPCTIIGDEVNVECDGRVLCLDVDVQTCMSLLEMVKDFMLITLLWWSSCSGHLQRKCPFSMEHLPQFVLEHLIGEHNKILKYKSKIIRIIIYLWGCFLLLYLLEDE